MARLRLALPPVFAVLTVGSALLVSACGSDGDTTSGSESQNANSPQKVQTGPTGKKGDDLKPKRKAPASAGDRKKAPDGVISDRPGSKARPVKP